MVWLIGNKGMLGSDVEAALNVEHLDYITSDIEVDITDIHSLKNFINNKKIRWIINCSAYTAVDNAEDDAETAFRVNADGAGNIALIAEELNAKLIHISTDYVYSGIKDEYSEKDETDPRGVYGKSKLRGDEYIIKTTGKHFIIRTSWLYGLNGNNFIKTMLKLFNEKELVSVVNDQWGSPTYTVDLADFILLIIKSDTDKYGIYHYSSEGRINWFQFAEYIYSKARELNLVDSDVKVKPITTEEFPTKAVRPKNSYLSKSKVKESFDIQISTWKDAVNRYLDAILKS